MVFLPKDHEAEKVTAKHASRSLEPDLRLAPCSDKGLQSICASIILFSWHLDDIEKLLAAPEELSPPEVSDVKRPA
jgi:hypothetical protein